MGGRQVYTCKHILTAFIFQFPGNSTYCGAMLGFLSKMLFNTALPNLAVPNCMDQPSWYSYWHLSVTDYEPMDCSSSDALIDLHCV